MLGRSLPIRGRGWDCFLYGRNARWPVKQASYLPARCPVRKLVEGYARDGTFAWRRRFLLPLRHLQEDAITIGFKQCSTPPFLHPSRYSLEWAFPTTSEALLTPSAIWTTSPTCIVTRHSTLRMTPVGKP